jgi:hypothetical protein
MKGFAKTIHGCAVLFALFIALSSAQANTEPGNFKHQSLKIDDYGLFDLGVADMNGDGLLDIFTTNHSAVQGMLLNKGPSGFENAYSQLKLDQDHAFPGLAIWPDEPPGKQPGIYINWVGPNVRVRAWHLKKGQSIRGRIDAYTPVKMLEKNNFDVNVNVDEENRSPQTAHSFIEFSGGQDGYFTFRPFNHALPFHFSFESGVEAENIYVGNQLISPESLDFTFLLRDRHGMAWADFNHDDRMDVFITRGGENGVMGKLPIPFWDELYIAKPTGMEDIGTPVGLLKEGCPGRQAAWMDYDGDNRLDLYIDCGRSNELHPNMLFKQTGDGHFENVAAKAELNLDASGSFVWLDIDRDHDMDLFWTDANGFFLYTNDNGVFSPVLLGIHRHEGIRGKPTVADFDNDGDLDIFSASMRGSTLLVNEDGLLTPISPTAVGLPARSADASWVDFDNDGVMDIHTVPDGLFVQKQKGKFSFHSRIQAPEGRFYPFQMTDARVTWFDADNDGTRDLVLASQWKIKPGTFAKWLAKFSGPDPRIGGLDYFWKVDLYKNHNHPENHWLQVELEGPPGNRQAIGAIVTVTTTDTRQIQQVGISDGSRYSQGHYRLYYGLGGKSEIAALRVEWPDGGSTEVTNPAVDRLIKVKWSER